MFLLLHALVLALARDLFVLFAAVAQVRGFTRASSYSFAAARAWAGSLHVLAFLLFVARAPVLAFARSSVLAVER